MATTGTTSASDLLERLGVDPALVTDGDLVVSTPITGEEIARVARTSEADTAAAVAGAVRAFGAWRDVPAPRRQGSPAARRLRRDKETLRALVTPRWGRSRRGPRRCGEMIDICDFAPGSPVGCAGRSPPSGRATGGGVVAPARPWP
jgi:aldehyde dehydrogenase (NAD+)